MQWHRHPCGIVYSQAFVEYLDRRQRDESTQHTEAVLSLDYVRCLKEDGPSSEWYQFSWLPPQQAAPQDLFHFGDAVLHMHRQTRTALKTRALDFNTQTDLLQLLR